MSLLTPTVSRPLVSILTFFTVFKALLLSIAISAAVAPDYDTSTTLFFTRHAAIAGIPSAASPAQRLTRWDAIYYMSAVRNGYVFEQDWAFGLGLPTLTAWLSSICTRLLGFQGSPGFQALLAISIAHVSHLIAVLALYQLTARLSGDHRLALVSSLLHIVSPSGLFLSAPYAESPFACLSMLGHLLYSKSFGGALRNDLNLIASGALFGLSITFRSNGLLNGIVFTVEAALALQQVAQSSEAKDARRFFASVTGGMLVAAGAVIPQVLAWQTYCSLENPRPWCSKLIPSIYGFVQETYW
jgi:GPI mannosyltransferase 2